MSLSKPVLTEAQYQQIVGWMDKGYEKLTVCTLDLFNDDGTCGCAVAAMLVGAKRDKYYRRRWQEILNMRRTISNMIRTKTSDNAAKLVLKLAGVDPDQTFGVHYGHDFVVQPLYRHLWERFDTLGSGLDYKAWLWSLTQDVERA